MLSFRVARNGKKGGNSRMDFIWESITEELKKWLVGGIMEQLSGMFDAVNRQVGDVAAQVGTSPVDFSPRIFSMIQNISESVIIPIAGIILTIIACYELIQMIMSIIIWPILILGFSLSGCLRLLWPSC